MYTRIVVGMFLLSSAALAQGTVLHPHSFDGVQGECGEWKVYWVDFKQIAPNTYLGRSEIHPNNTYSPPSTSCPAKPTFDFPNGAVVLILPTNYVAGNASMAAVEDQFPACVLNGAIAPNMRVTGTMSCANGIQYLFSLVLTN